jgi:hypothetical protein
MLASDMELIYQTQKRAGSLPAWAKSERLDYCENEYSKHKVLEKARIARDIAPRVMPAFINFHKVVTMQNLFRLLARGKPARTIR